MLHLKPMLGLTALLLAGGAAAVAAPPAQRQDGNPAPRIDGASSVAPEARHARVRYPIRRVAPDAPVDGIVLGATRPAPARDAEPGEPRDHRPNFGYVEPVAVDYLASPNWSPTEAGGSVWSIEFAAPGAAALRVKLHGRFGDDGMELRVYDPVGGNAFGPYTRPRLDENGDWWTTIIFGESIGLEFHIPADAETSEPRMPGITAIARYTSVPGAGPRGCSFNDATCFPEWANHARAVCMLATVQADDDVVGFCSGALLNRSPSDLSPLVLTADHCLDTQAAANSASYVWFFDTAACDGAAPSPNDLPRSDGSLLLKVRDNSDMNLVGLYEPPAGDFWLGWDAGGWLLQSDAFGISHPAGTFKKLSEGDVTAALFVTYGLNSAHVWRVHWDSGGTTGGSSGSPILDASGRVRGQLKGGPADCDHGDYGRFGVSYETLEPYIWNMASPVYVEAGAGGTQRGTSADPFDGVYEATFCVFAGDEVRIRAGNYADRCTIWRPMTLNSEGGVARVGVP